MEWISILICPISGKNLRALQPNEINDINIKVATNQLWQADGKPMTEMIEKGLITIDGKYIYPIINEIVLLLKDLALVDSQDKVIKDSISADKQLVKNFYEEKGWFADEAGNYKDAVIFEDLRPFAQDYITKCHNRVSRFLNPSGKYLMDAASGALQYDDYLQYSKNYKYRVCVDFSFQALSECKRKLGNKALCILADITNMPFKDNVMDGFVSLNTIYHIPKDEQVTAIKELHRVLAIGGKGVVVYEWFKHSVWMNFWLLPFRAFTFIKNRLIEAFNKMMGNTKSSKWLYFYAHSPAYFLNNLPKFKLRVWRSLNISFMRYYLHSWFFGKQILEWIYNMEERAMEECGLKGEYPMLVFEK